MSLFAELMSTVFARRLPAAAAAEDDRPTEALVAALLGEGGEVSGVALAQRILDRYARAGDAERLAFFRHLAEDLSLSPDAVRAALSDFEAGQNRRSYAAFMEAAEPKRQEAIRRLNQPPGATRDLVQMRADLLRLGRKEDALQALDLDFRHLFRSWFNRGFLVLRPISWESPAHILEKIIAYEAVHDINGWEDLRRRLRPDDRRCFAFFHPAMPDEPLIFVEVALTRGVPGSVQSLLAESREGIAAREADSAVFYSISNCQTGLAGISFGNSLIKQVAADLSAELPGLKTFVTLSPIPGLCRWAEAQGIPVPDAPERLRALAARYLTGAKRSDGAPLDPVARFHLGNGALVHQVHAGADTSPKGLHQSAGAMVNYLYDLSAVSRNHEAYAKGHAVAASAEIQALAEEGAS